MRTSQPGRLGLLGLGTLAGLLGAASTRAANIAGTGTGIIGQAPDTTLTGTENDHAGSNSAINDNDPSTHVDDFPHTTNDYVGITFGPAQSGVTNLQLTMAMFVDGGWYGPSGAGPSDGNALPATDLTAPVVQVFDGTTWTNAASTDDYVSVMTGAHIGGNGFPNPNNSPISTFTLVTPANGILGIRLLGNGGGTAGEGGFIGVSELAVNTPEPATLGLLAAGSLLTLRRRRH